MTRSRKLPETEQLNLPFTASIAEKVDRPDKEHTDSPPNFKDPSPEKIFIGDEPLKQYLFNNDLGWVVRLREIITQVDLSLFTAAYENIGRKAIHPKIMLSLIFYGILLRQWSLRDLEKLARRDVGAWWLCAGLQPDHSTIGRFINLHAEVLTEPYFISLTKWLVKQLKISPGDMAGDGTVIEACGSRLRTLKAEAAREAARQARQQAGESPDDEHAQHKAEELERAVQAAEQRERKADYKGNKNKGVRVCTSEPDAVIQPQKDKTYRPSYKPSICANNNRFIVGQGLHPSSETAVVDPMFQQHQLIFGAMPKGCLLDASYHTFGILGLAVNLNVDLLCPSGTVEVDDHWQKGSRKGMIPKSEFIYDEKNDTYLCPAGQRLYYQSRGKDHHGNAFRRYQCQQSESCPYRERCTTGSRGRRVKRYEGESLKEAMTKVLEHPKAKQKYRQRRAMVEPVFSVLRYRQGLQRFHRRGLDKVKLEFALHCAAYNLGRAIALERQNGPYIGLVIFYYHYRSLRFALGLFMVRFITLNKFPEEITCCLCINGFIFV